jgi:epsilon-lactone hydrolase
MKMQHHVFPTLLLLLAQSAWAQAGGSSETQSSGSQPTIDADGTVHIPSLAVPLSAHMSEEAKSHFIQQFMQNKDILASLARVQDPARGADSPATDCPERDVGKRFTQPIIDRARAVYPVTIERQTIAGVQADVITPKAGIPGQHRNRVLINVHGGGYSCASAGGLAGQAEAIPIVGAGKFKVIAIDYRTAPQAHFPQATEEVAAVYRELLKRYKPKNIGIFGCSTGATLTAGAVAWFQKQNLPRPGAVGLFGDGATKDDHVDGDGWFINVPLNGGEVLDTAQNYAALRTESYMQGTDYNDPLVAPVVSRAVLSKFPPTLVISGTRDVSLSEALYTHTQLVKAGVAADLHVWEGQWHCSFVDVDLPESQEMYDVTTKFFDRHLGGK